jgi:16S rRNA (guanine(966)-N(2))-methyltransferase RsmD
MDRMRESVFAALAGAGGSLAGRSFLDLFSGSGIVALEAVSRGASPAECVEKDKAKRAVLLQNAALARTMPGAFLGCHFMSVELFLQRTKKRFDLIFCDPPFPYQFRQSLLETVSERNILLPGGLLLIHRPAEAPLPPALGTLSLRESRVYGRSVADFYGTQEA